MELLLTVAAHTPQTASFENGKEAPGSLVQCPQNESQPSVLSVSVTDFP